MAQSRMQIRDMEILRTLLRLRYVTTREMVAAFFQGERVGQRRLQVLSGRGLIRAHSKGLPPRSNYRAWRLTSDGIDVVSREFPDDDVPDGLAERLAEGSLYNLDHREEISRVYLDLVRGPEAGEGEGPVVRAAMMRRRANQIDWQADGAVQLEYKYASKDYVVIPDATLTSRFRPRRFYLELDRSTKPLSRIKENLNQYRIYLRDVYDKVVKDGKEPGVMYIARSKARQASIVKLMKENLGRDFRWSVSLSGHTTGLLESQTMDLEQVEEVLPAAPESVPLAQFDGLRQASRGLFNWTNKLVRYLDSQGLLDRTAQATAELIEEGKAEMRVLYPMLEEPGHGG